MATNTTPHAEIGMILASTWGYDQTNVDFYEVVHTTAKTVTLRKIASRRRDAAANMTYTAEPAPGEYVGEPFRRKIATWSTRGVAVTINSCANAYEWDGRAIAGSSYA